MLILTSKSPSYGTFPWLEVQLGLPEPRLLYLEENGMVLVRSLGKGQISRVKTASIDSLLGGRWCGRVEEELNVSAFFLGHLRVIFERDGLGGGVCVGAAVDGGVWINGEGGAVGDG